MKFSSKKIFYVVHSKLGRGGTVSGILAGHMHYAGHDDPPLWLGLIAAFCYVYFSESTYFVANIFTWWMDPLHKLKALIWVKVFWVSLFWYQMFLLNEPFYSWNVFLQFSHDYVAPYIYILVLPYSANFTSGDRGRQSCADQHFYMLRYFSYPRQTIVCWPRKKSCILY
jgi:hypothetical protein